MTIQESVPECVLRFTLDGEQTTVVINRSPLCVGRSSDCDVCVAHPSLSPRHARFVYDGDSWWIENQEATDSTFVNGASVDRQVLHDGDHVRLGEIEMRFSLNASRAEFDKVKGNVYSKLIGMLDLSALGQLDANLLRPELAGAIECLGDAEDVVLSPAERVKLVDEIFDQLARDTGVCLRAPEAAPEPPTQALTEFEKIKHSVHVKLVAGCDFSVVGDPKAIDWRRELGSAAEQICEQEGASLSPAERVRLVNELLDQMLGTRPQETSLEPSTDGVNDSGQIATTRGRFDEDPAVERDSVDCTVFAPPLVRRAEPFLVQVFAHLPAEADAVALDAVEFDEDARRRGVTSLGAEVARGSTLTFELRMPGAVIDESVRDLVWRGRRASVQFGVEIPADVTRESLLGTVAVSQDSIPIGSITVKLKLADHVVPQQPEPTGQARRYTQAFISYASADRSEVLRRVQMLKSVGISFFQDVLSLEPGERWAQRLYERIDHSDVLFLFWSSSAKASEWVAKEWQYALEKKGDDFIRPVGIEGPPIPAPPEELKHIHFGDPLLYFIQ